MNTKQRHERITKKLGEWHKKLFDLQAECEHPNAIGTYESDTGNWCPSDDCYWLWCKCPDCGKQWKIDSKEPGYRMFSSQMNRKVNRL